MNKLIQRLIVKLMPVFVSIIVIEYLLKFGFKEFTFSKLMDILPRMAIDFGIIVLGLFVYYFIKSRRKKQDKTPTS